MAQFSLSARWQKNTAQFVWAIYIFSAIWQFQSNMLAVMCYNRFAMKPTPATYIDRIVLDPAILAGKPVIKGTRIPVELVLERLEEDVETTLLFADYPQLTPEDIQACLWYAKELVRGEEVYPVAIDHPTHQQSPV